MLLAVAISIGPSATAYFLGRAAMDRALTDLRAGGPKAVSETLDRLGRYRPLVYLDDLVHAYGEANDEPLRARISQVYSQLTSQDIDIRLETLTTKFD